MLAAPCAAYDVPNFDRPGFSADGVFLPENRRNRLLEALTALASNFPSSPRIDSDIQEKALGIALQLDPMHVPAREAHESLVIGKFPRETEFFTDSLSSISEALWTASENLLSAPREPEEARLAPYLMELSLLIHPEPPGQRLAAFARETGGQGADWTPFLTLQNRPGGTTREARKIAALGRRELKEARQAAAAAAEAASAQAEKPASTDTSAETGAANAPNDTTENMADSSPPEESAAPEEPSPPGSSVESAAPVVPANVVFPGIHTVKSIETRPVHGETLLRLRELPPPDEPLPLLLRDNPILGDDSLLPLGIFGRGLQIANLEISRSFAEQKGWTWPDGAVGLFNFSTDQAVPRPRRVAQVSGRLPAMILLEIALAGATRNEEFLLAGDVLSPEASPSLGGEFIDLVEAIPEPAPQYLLTPNSLFEALVYHLQTTEELPVLFQQEWVSYTSADEAMAAVLGETPESLLEASRSFREIEEVSERMPLVELARNEKVQERLQGILDAYPRHLSARAMLEFGTRPTSPEIERLAAANRIRRVVDPYRSLRANPAPEIREGLREELREAETKLSRMRLEIPTTLTEYFESAVEVLEAADAYFSSLDGSSSSLTQQRLLDTEEAIRQWDINGRPFFGEEEDARPQSPAREP